MVQVSEKNFQKKFTNTPRGAVSHSAGTAPIITLFILGTSLKTTPLQKEASSTQHSIGCRPQDPGARGYRWWKTADCSHSARCALRMLLPLCQTECALTLTMFFSRITPTPGPRAAPPFLNGLPADTGFAHAPFPLPLTRRSPSPVGVRTGTPPSQVPPSAACG